VWRPAQLIRRNRFRPARRRPCTSWRWSASTAHGLRCGERAAGRRSDGGAPWGGV